MMNPLDLKPALDRLLSKAHHFGADSADALATHGRSLHVTVRGGEMEDVDNSEGQDVGLRVLIGRRQACVSSSDLSETALDQLAERAVAMAKLAPEDPYCGLADNQYLEKRPPDLQLFDPTDMTPSELMSRALDIEKAALSIKGVKQAEGSTADFSQSSVYFQTSNGFEGGWLSSRHGLSAMAIAEKDGQMERDYDMQGQRWLADLQTPESVGICAGERAIQRIGSQQMKSGTMPVMFDRRVSGSLVSAILGAINGNAIARGTSFLKDSMTHQISTEAITLIDDPLIQRGHASRPWDGEGVIVKPLKLIDQGVLKGWLLNCSSARKLGLKTTGHATRGIGAPPGIGSSNAYIQAGTKTPAELIKTIETGLWITDMFGPSLNNNTGDYSVGVSGFRIQNGTSSYPVNEITVAGNLLDMLKVMTPANDLIFDASTVAPSLLIDSMTVAGQ